MKPVVFHPEARAELTASAQFYEQQREGLGLEFASAVEAAVERIRLLPQAGAVDQTTGRQKHVMRRFPFNTFYHEFADVIWIAAVAHQRRRPHDWADREPDPLPNGGQS